MIGNSSNKKKSEFLGLPYGTAIARLRKKILFHLVVKLKENFCFKCSEIIDDIKDLSIEHKLPWEGRSVDLFWDIDNISFSHIRCNVPHFQGAVKLRKEAPEGMAWCRAHKCFESIENFWKNEKRWNGLMKCCKEFSKEDKERWRESRREKGLPVT